MFSFKLLNAWKGENTLEEKEHVHLNFLIMNHKGKNLSVQKLQFAQKK